MLPPRQLSVFVLFSSACAGLLALSTSSTAIRAMPLEQNRSALTVKTLSSSVANGYHSDDQPHQDNSGSAQAVMNTPGFDWEWITETENAVVVDETIDWRLAIENEIPFPLYPNGTRYRIGGERGMKIVLFETTDDFSTVDAYYDQQSAANGLARKQLTQDYVQYLQPQTSEDANQTGPESQSDAQPGVVIYEFLNADEALKLGAAPESRTNIIISFK